MNLLKPSGYERSGSIPAHLRFPLDASETVGNKRLNLNHPCSAAIGGMGRGFEEPEFNRSVFLEMHTFRPAFLSPKNGKT